MGISYPNVLFLRDIWTMHDLEQCSVCSDEINEGEPSIIIIDKDDFSNDTLTGGGTAHHCNWMFLQCLKHCNSRSQEIEASLYDVPMRIQDAKFVSQLLSEKASEMQSDSIQDHQMWRTSYPLQAQIHSAIEALLMF